MSHKFYGNSFLSTEPLTHADVIKVFKKADQMKRLVKTRGGNNSLKGKVMGALFYEPSSRTFSSFITAMQRLGGGFIPLNGMGNTSVAKGESLKDTANVFSSYADVLVIRNPETGSAKEFADYARVPVMNAGDGLGEHPTQALLDLYTIKEEFKRLENIHIVFVGEFAHYRLINSLAMLLAEFPKIKMTFVSTKEGGLQQTIRDYLNKRKIKITELEDLEDVIKDADVLYVTRPKKEFISPKLYKKVVGKYTITKKTLDKMKRKSIVMHTLPRLDEIASEVDDDPRAVYLTKQMESGLYIRMALLELMFKK